MGCIMRSNRNTGKRLRLGTRGSPLALAQAREARRRICHASGLGEDAVELYPITTTGDRQTDRPLVELGGKGLFAKEIDRALLSEEIDLAVHSAKDLPGNLPPGLGIAAALPRASPFDCLVCECAPDIGGLPRNAQVGTCSPRRQAQLLHLRPDLEIAPLRGNVGTRLSSVAPRGTLTATVLAAAGLQRLGIGGKSIHAIGPAEMLPAIGQGVIAALVRADDAYSRTLAGHASDPASEFALAAERSLVRCLEGDCHTPVAGLAMVQAGDIRLIGEILTFDGSRRIRKEISGPTEEAEALGRLLASRLLGAAGADFWERLS